MVEFTDDMQKYLKQLNDTIKQLDLATINNAINAIVDAWERDADIYVFGNGGSAATASHMANDFNKGISCKLDKKFRMHCLCDNVSTVMAIANDIGYDEVFRFQLHGILRQSDLVIGISGSGNSKNVINAIKYAKEIGAKTVGITGFDGGWLKKISDYHMDVGIDDMQIVEDVHIVLNHMMMRVLGDRL